MRIIWDEQNSKFQAEIGLHTEHWKDDVDLLKLAKFKTEGPPAWEWKTDKISSLDYLRNNRPQSGLTITEHALEKYNFLKQQLDKKKELKKLYETANKQADEAAAPKWETYQDPDTGITCYVVKPIEEVFTWKYVPPKPPDVYCFVCASPVYDYEYPDLCLWCSKNN